MFSSNDSCEQIRARNWLFTLDLWKMLLLDSFGHYSYFSLNRCQGATSARPFGNSPWRPTPLLCR
jgi:hypothetical protein